MQKAHFVNRYLCADYLTAKTLLVMKLTSFFILLGCLQLSARGFTQTLSIKETNVPLKQIFQKIEQQTGFTFIYRSVLLNDSKNVSINVSNASLDEVLKICFKDQPLSYKVFEKIIAVQRKPPSEFRHGVPLTLPPIDVRGRVVNETGEPVTATVTIKGTKREVSTNQNGEFEIKGVDDNAVLIISGVNIETFEVRLNGRTDLASLRAKPKITDLEVVQVISTGYQDIPKDRATGSFVHVNNELFNRRVSNNILDRLEDMVPGLIFNRDRADLLPYDMTIRGNSTIYANGQPLIVVDNFPFDGSIDQINPNDVESITILRDAAAASIWGARAGNGVIVITTKKGNTAGRPRISFNSNITVTQPDDPFYQPLMDIGEFIDFEKKWFAEGKYNSSINSRLKPVLPPVANTLLMVRNGEITEDDANNLIEQFKTQDVRRDLSKYYFQNRIHTQYALNVAGGSENHSYVFSGGYDGNRQSIVGNSDRRITLNSQSSWKMFNQRLEAVAGLYYTSSSNSIQTDMPTLGTTKYWSLADESGNSLPVPRYRESFVNEAESNGLLNWQYFPVDEIGLLDHKLQTNDLRINTTLGYKLNKSFRAEVLYQYWTSSGQNRQLNPQETFFTRNLINNYSQPDGPGNVNRIIGEGAILDLSNIKSYSHSLRSQLHYNKSWRDDTHFLTGLVGSEMKDYQAESNSSRYYGYDDVLGLSQPVDYVNRYSLYYNGSLLNIPSNFTHEGLIDRFISYYSNISYVFQNKYTFTGSVRKDESNLFGVNANQRGVPLWSAGLSWDIFREAFYKSSWMPYLKLRLTYGYNGNIDKSTSAYTTAWYMNAAYNRLAGLRYVQVQNPANPELRWEKVQILNAGIDFRTKENRISGNVEFYRKKGIDLIGDRVFPSSSGVNVFRGNFANLRVNGMDMAIHFRNNIGALSWQTHLLFSHSREEVTKYDMESSYMGFLSYGRGLGGLLPSMPVEGFPLQGIYSYATDGLDPQTGDPLGFYKGDVSKDYRSIIMETSFEDLVYHGSGRPTSFGSLRNDFSWKGISLSLNLSYRFGYYIRRTSVNYSTFINSRTIAHADYHLRWQKPGDELKTEIPSMPVTVDNNRENFYQRSSSLVERADNIRLQDIRFSYQVGQDSRGQKKWNKAELYVYVNNLGIVWKASDNVEDPDYLLSNPRKSFAAGVRIEL